MIKSETDEIGELHTHHKFVAVLEKLESETGSGPGLITLYIPPYTPIHEATGHLKDEYDKTDRISARETRYSRATRNFIYTLASEELRATPT